MYKLVISFLALFCSTIFAQESLETYVLNSDTTELQYPQSIIFAQNIDGQIPFKINNGTLYLSNPGNIQAAKLYIILSDGTAKNIFIKSGRKNNYRGLNFDGQTRNKVTYSKRYTNAQLSPSNGSFIRDTNNFRFSSIINKDTSWQFKFSDISNERNSFSSYNSQYQFKLTHKDFFIEQGMNRLYNKLTTGLANNGLVEGTRLGYHDSDLYFDILYGRGFLNINTSGSEIVGTSLYYKFNQAQLGGNYSQTLDGEDKIPLLEWYTPLTKNWSFGGGIANHQSDEFSSVNRTMRLNYADQKNVLGLSSFFINHAYTPEGRVDLVFGQVSSQQIESISSGANFIIYRPQVDENLNLTIGTTRQLTDFSIQNTYNTGLRYNLKKINTGINFQLSEQEDNFNNTSSFKSTSPFFSYRHSSGLTTNVYTASSFASESENTKSSAYRLAWQNISPKQIHGLGLSTGATESELSTGTSEVKNYSANYNFKYKFSDQISATTGVSSVFSNLQNQEQDNYYLDVYSYSIGANFLYKRIHNLGLVFAHSTNLRPITQDIKNNRFGLNYFLNFGFNTVLPINYLINNKSIKGHLFVDENFNGVKDSNEKLLSNTQIIIKDELDKEQTTTTDKDGFLSVKNLESKTYYLSLKDEDYQIITSNQSVANLKEGSLFGDIGVGKTRTISVKIFDKTTSQVLKNSISLNINCPTIKYDKTYQIKHTDSDYFVIPQAECFITPIPLNFNSNFKSKSFQRRLILNNEVIFEIEQFNELQFTANWDTFDYQKNKVFINIDDKSYDINKIISIEPKNSDYLIKNLIINSNKVICVSNPKSVSFERNFYSKKIIQINCKLK